MKLIFFTVMACLCLGIAGCIVIFDFEKPQIPPTQKASIDEIDWVEYERARDSGELDANHVVKMEKLKTRQE